MNILYIDHYAGSLEYGMEFRPYYLAKEWVKLGHKVRIVGADFSHLRIKNPIVKNDFDTELIDGIEYQWIKTIKYKGNGTNRALSMFQFCWKLWTNAQSLVDEFRPDVVITSSTYPLDTYPGQRIAKITHAKLIHENHDIWPLTLTTIGGMSKYHPFVLLMNLAARSAFKKSNEIVCVLPYAYEYMLEMGMQSKEKFHYIPNGIVKEEWLNPEPLPELHAQTFDKLSGKFIVGYVGGHSISNALDTLIEAASQINNKNIAFVLIGQGAEKGRLIEKSKALGCCNISFLPSVSKKVIPTILKKIDAAYIASKKSPLEKYGASINKAYDYMMASKPILYGVDSRNNEVEDAQCGITIEPANAGSLVNAIETIFNKTKLDRTKMGERGKKWVVYNCEYSILAKKFLNVINKKYK